MAYKLYLNGSKEFLRKNYLKSDSILSLSIDSYAYIDNVSLRGLVKLYQKDTVGFCKDMKSIMFYDENANNNYCNFCKDTIYYDKSFLSITDKSDYFEVKEKVGYGFVYDLTKSDLAFAFYNYHDTLKVYERMDNMQRNSSTQTIMEYIHRKVYIPKEIKQLLRSANIIEFSMILICIASEEGNIIYCKNGSTQSPIDKTNLKKEEKEKIKNTLFEIAKNAALNAPIAEPVMIGNRNVKAQYAFRINF